MCINIAIYGIVDHIYIKICMYDFMCCSRPFWMIVVYQNSMEDVKQVFLDIISMFFRNNAKHLGMVVVAAMGIISGLWKNVKRNVWLNQVSIIVCLSLLKLPHVKYRYAPSNYDTSW